MPNTVLTANKRMLLLAFTLFSINVLLVYRGLIGNWTLFFTGLFLVYAKLNAPDSGVFKFLQKNKRYIYLATIVLVFAVLVYLGIMGMVSFPGYVLAATGVLTSLFLLFHQRIIRFIHSDVLVENLPITRVLYGLACLFTAIQHLKLIPYGIEPMNFNIMGFATPSPLAYVATIIYILAIISLILGKWIRLSWIILFLVGGLVIPFSLETFVKMPINFFAMFIPPAMWLGKKSSSNGKDGWPLMIMGLSFAILITAAGVFKMIDPIWLKNLGLYYSLNIPFFFPKHLAPLLDYYPLMVAGNWLTIIVEVLALPLFLFKRTRTLALIATACLGFFLAYPMGGIGMVGGPIILTMVPALLSITGVSLGKYVQGINKFINQLGKNDYTDDPPKTMPVKYYSLGMVVMIYTMLGYMAAAVPGIHFLSYWPPQYDGYTCKTQWLPINKAARYRLSMFNSLVLSTRPLKFWESSYILPLFDYHHLFERVIFRVVYTDANGQEKEYTSYYNDDGTLSDKYPLLYNERFFLASWKIMTLVIHSHDYNSKEIDSDFQKEFNAIINYSLDGHDITKEQLEKATVEIKLLHQPVNYQGNTKPWATQPWVKFYEYQFADQSAKLIEIPELFDYKTLDIPAFKNCDIITNRENSSGAPPH